ncbi:MAG: cytidylate kinase [Planctomycetes bacterium GWF2_50_10]|nr:MAG: cytidylate kinase [Planctomycetes bacterium GWF2_50_10]
MATLVITIDGPAASGKSTLAKLLAQKLGAYFLDTGAMYRAVTLAAMKKAIPLADSAAISKMMDNTDFEFSVENGHAKAMVDGVDISEKIRDPQITENVHFVASAPLLRSRLVEMQRKFAAAHQRIVTEGRDQGTVAFPNADVKFFLTADSAERARRRQTELDAKGAAQQIETTAQAMAKRDSSDQNRTVGALVPAIDAIMIDSTGLSIEQVLETMLGHIGPR